MTSKPEQKILETLPKGAEIMNMVRIQMNFYPNPHGPTLISVPCAIFQEIDDREE
jgi:hypothetical protein